MEKILNTRVLLKTDTLENWNNSTLALKKGEIAIATVAATAGTGLTEPVVMIKIGEDGVKTFNELPWNFYAKASDVIAACKSESTLTDFINNVIAGAGIATDEALATLTGRVTTAEGNIDALEALVGNTSVDTQIAQAVSAAIGEGVAKLLTDLKDITEDYNDYKILRSYNPKDLIFVWNSDAMARVEKRDLPTIYHKDIIDRLGEHVLPARYFGTKNTTSKEGNGTTIRSLVEQTLTKASSPTMHVFAGQLIPAGYTAPANTSYTVDNTILFKVFHKKSVPYMSAFEVGTSFFNQGSLTDTNFLTWGHNTLDYLKQYPCVTVKKA